MDARHQPPVRRTSYATADPLEAREFLGEAYGTRLQMSAVRRIDRPLTLDRVEAGDAEFASIDLPVDLKVRLPGQGRYVFATIIDGFSSYELQGETVRYGRGDVHLGITPEGDDLAEIRHLHSETVSLPAALFDDLITSEGAPAPGWRFTSTRPVVGGDRRWRQTVVTVRELVSDLDGLTAPLITGPASRLLAATALSAFPNTALQRPVSKSRADAHPATLRRALSFIDASPNVDLTVADIARAAHVTPRALQLAFRRHLDTTPMTYLRRVRLAHAREQLQHGQPNDGTTVTRTAIDWGFANPSRFTQHYRATYGESPSETLRS